MGKERGRNVRQMCMNPSSEPLLDHDFPPQLRGRMYFIGSSEEAAGVHTGVNEPLSCLVQGSDVWLCFDVLISCCRATSQSCAKLLSPRPFPQHPTRAVSFSRAPCCVDRGCFPKSHSAV